MKKKTVILLAVLILAAVCLFNSVYTVEENEYGEISVGQPPPLNIFGTEQWNQRIFSIIPSSHSGTHHEDSL
mgnify:CR=1 FL=1